VSKNVIFIFALFLCRFSVFCDESARDHTFYRVLFVSFFRHIFGLGVPFQPRHALPLLK